MPVSGLVNKWPFHAEKKSYDVWDDVTKTSPPADYAGETTMDGLKVYQYHQVITDAPIDLGNDIQGIYNLDETYSIDPVTGKIIDQQVHDVRTLKDGGDTALDLTAEYTPETIQSNVDDAKAGAKQLTLITKTLPIVGLVVGSDLRGARGLPAAARRRRRVRRSPPRRRRPTRPHRPPSRSRRALSPGRRRRPPSPG